MREILTDIDRWQSEGKPIALATVVRTWGSAPRPAGSKMAVSQAGEMTGSVSGGCVEGAVVEEALGVLRTRRPKLLRFGVSNETAWEVGLACGGQIEIFVEPWSSPGRPLSNERSVLDELRARVERDQPAVRAVVVRGPEGILGRSGLLLPDGEWSGDLGSQLEARLRPGGNEVLTSGMSHVFDADEAEVFLDALMPPPTLVIVGAVHIAISLTRLAKELEYRVLIVDPRRAFATTERFPQADSLLRQWPPDGLRTIGLTSTTAVAVLSHDPKLDDPALIEALRSPAFYVGALGSETTQAARRRRLLEAGVSEEQLSRLHAPIGIDLGGESPEEIALSILAEIVAVRAARAQKIAAPSTGPGPR
ncbi:MAG TPA: XdhC/CoxI family protein [Anaerolineales bacterium]|nr:XdhC/CoxI family protein [Anaerolineales bacterium]